MEILKTALPYIQITLSLLLIIGVLIQRSDTSAGGAFGGADVSNAVRTRRGGERVIFIGTIVISILFVATCFVALLI